jgi:dienelactone hydrolase
LFAQAAGDIDRDSAVLLIHDRMGLTDGIKDAAFRLARQDYVVLAVDLYRGRTAKNKEEAERLERELPRQRVLGDLKAAMDYLCQREEVRAEQEGERKIQLGAVGLGIGGSYAMEAALGDPRLRALALCYCRLPTQAKQLTTLKASVFGIFAGRDNIVPAEMIAQFTEAMKEADKHLFAIRSGPLVSKTLEMKEAAEHLYAIRVYGESPHGFLDPADWPIYGKPPEGDVEDAWELIARFLDRLLM